MNKFPFLIIYQQQKQLRSPLEILSNLVAIQRPTQPVIQPLSDNIKESVLEDKVSECLNFYVVIINYLLFYAFTTIMPLLNNLINLFIFYFCNCFKCTVLSYSVVNNLYYNKASVFIRAQELYAIILFLIIQQLQ